MMKTFAQWCEHYGYDPASDEARADYARYQEQLALFQALPQAQPTNDERDTDTSTVRE